MHDYEKTYREDTRRPTRYFSNFRTGAVVDAIREAQDTGGPVNIVGHSWGATSAYNAAAQAAREGLRVDNLVTLDPVGRPWLGGIRGREDAGEWLNVDAAPLKPDLNDRIAAIGGKPSQVPVAQADRSIRVQGSHADVPRMVWQGGVRRVLDGSRKLADAPQDGLHDGVPTPEWMRRRDGDIRTRRGY